MAFCIADLTKESIESAEAYWFYPPEERPSERWPLVPGSEALSPSGDALRMTFELPGGRTFELVLIQRGSSLSAKFDDREDPDEEVPARVFESSDQVIIMFSYRRQTVFLRLELAA